MKLYLTIKISIIILILNASTISAQVAVIVHPDVVSDTLSITQLRDIYTGDKTFWPDKCAILVSDLNDDKGIHDRFYDYISLSSSRVKSIWMKRMLSGQSDPPLIFEEGTGLVAWIADTPGAIGFVASKDVNESVKVLLRIDTGHNDIQTDE